MTGSQAVRVLGGHMVMDPSVCHGKPTFRGTRILVADVLEQVSSGIAWETIVEQWDGKVTIRAIQEAVNLASDTLMAHAEELATLPEPA